MSGLSEKRIISSQMDLNSDETGVVYKWGPPPGDFYAIATPNHGVRAVLVCPQLIETDRNSLELWNKVMDAMTPLCLPFRSYHDVMREMGTQHPTMLEDFKFAFDHSLRDYLEKRKHLQDIFLGQPWAPIKIIEIRPR